MSFSKYNKSYYQYHLTYRIYRADQTKEVRISDWDSDILYNQLHFWNKKRITESLNNEFLKKLIKKEKNITCIEVLEEKFVLVSRYTYEVD